MTKNIDSSLLKSTRQGIKSESKDYFIHSGDSLSTVKNNLDDTIISDIESQSLNSTTNKNAIEDFADEEQARE